MKAQNVKRLVRLAGVSRGKLVIAVAFCWLLMTGCQGKKQTAVPVMEDTRGMTFEIADSGQVRSVDEQTAEFLKSNRAIGSLPSEEPNQVITAPVENTEGQVIAVEAGAQDVTQSLPNDLPPLGKAPVAQQGEPKVIASSPASDDVSNGPTESGEESLSADDKLLAPPLQPVPFSVRIPVLDEPGMADEMISVDFNEVDILFVLKTVSEITGINFIVKEGVSGKVSVLSPTQIRLGDLYGFLESILEMNGYAAVPVGDQVKIVPRAEASGQNRHIRIGADPAQIAQSDSVITQIIPLRHAEAGQVSNILRPLLATDSYLATHPPNSILITDTSANIHHLAKMIQQLDVPGAKEAVTVLPLKYASAQVLSKQISDVLAQEGNNPAQKQRGGAGAHIETQARILPDIRTNALIIRANAQETGRIVEAAKRLDVEQPQGATNVHVQYLKNAPAEELAKDLTAALLPNLEAAGAIGNLQQVHIAANVGTNSLVITATAQDYKVLNEIIEKLDIVREQVLVELKIIEVSEDVLQEIGIDWATLDEAVADSVRYFADTNFGVRLDRVQGNLRGFSVGAFKQVGENVGIAGILHALEKTSGVNVLLTPSILTSNHQSANIIAADTIAFVDQSRITETTDLLTPTVIKSFSYQDVGVILDITPHVSQGGVVRLEVESEFTKLIESVTGVSSDTPTRAKRRVETTVTMMSGATIVIGGLIRDDKVTVEHKIPVLGDIPLLGHLFRAKKDQMQKTNLLIFITPYVLGSPESLDEITRKKQAEMAPKLQSG